MAGQPVVTQPTASNAFVLPHNLQQQSCPHGLEYLTQIDQVIIKQQIELLEIITGFETNNKYRIFNSMGQQIYYAKEETDCLMRQCCGPSRGFTIHITDNNNQEVMRVVREFKCCAGCCWCAASDCCSLELQVEAPVGTVIGYVRQMGSCWAPVYGIFDANHEQIATIKGPCCVCNAPCCGDVEFPVLTLEGEGQQMAMVAKQWTGIALEMFTDADTFSIRFPLNLDVKVKSTLFGAMFMIDFMFFEHKQNNNH